MNKPSKALKRSISKINSHSYFVAVSRAAWAIFACLKIHKTNKNQVIAMPSFICQSVVAAVLAAGWKILFIDINIENANVSSEEYLRAMKANKIDAILFVHLLGNRNKLRDLQTKCTENGILLIEDSAQFCTSEEYTEEGNLSHIRILSFGYSKPIDAGGGGILCTEDKTLKREIEDLRNSYCFKSQDRLKENSVDFKKRFYELKDLVADNQEEKLSFQDLLRVYTPLLDLEFPFSDYLIERIVHGIDSLKKNTIIRRENWEKYLKYIKCDSMSPLLEEESIPWRAAFRIDNISYSKQHEISNSLREKGFDVSNWYLPAHWYIDSRDSTDLKLENTVKLSKEIIQFWVDKEFNINHFKSLNNNLNKLINE